MHMPDIVVNQPIGYIQGVIFIVAGPNRDCGLVASKKGSTESRTMICCILCYLVLVSQS